MLKLIRGDLMNWLRNSILLLTALGAVASVYVKISRDFCMESIKSKYKNVPGKQSIFEVVTVFIMYNIVILDMLMLPVIAINIYSSFKNGAINKISIENNIQIIANIIVFLVVFIILNAIISPAFIYINIESKFLRKLEKKPFKEVGSRIKFWNNISMLFPIIIPVVELILIAYSVKISLTKYENNFIFINNISEDNMNLIITLTAMSFICTTSFILQISLKEIIKAIGEKFIYIIKMDNEEIRSDNYLEYNDCYLVFEHGQQRFISKSKVKEISKSTYKNSIITQI